MSASNSPRDSYADTDADETTERCSAVELATMREAARAAGPLLQLGGSSLVHAELDDARTTRSGDSQVVEILREISRAAVAAPPEAVPFPLITRTLPAAMSTKRLSPDDTVSIRKRGGRRFDWWLVVAVGFAVVFGVTCGALFAKYVF